MEIKNHLITKIMNLAPVIPVLVVENIPQAVNLASALVKGGLPAIEVTLRTNVALEAIRAISDNVEGATVGAGTVLNANQMALAEAAGSQFFVSPGVSQHLLDAANDSSIPLLPGIASPSEAMALGEKGFRALKFFPAEQAGGAPFLRAISAPLPDFVFCPTGGIGLKTAPEYLKLANVLCVGGSWVAPQALIEAQDWSGIIKLAAQAVKLSR